MRTRAYRRNEREKHIKRKENFLRMSQSDNRPYYYDAKDYSAMQPPKIKAFQYFSEGNWLPYYIVHARGQLNKGKIYCSCPRCTRKTRNKGHRRTKGHRRHYPNYYPSINYKSSDQRKIDNMKEQEKEFRLVV